MLRTNSLKNIRFFLDPPLAFLLHQRQRYTGDIIAALNMHIHKQLPDVGVNFVTILQRVIANSIDRKASPACGTWGLRQGPWKGGDLGQLYSSACILRQHFRCQITKRNFLLVTCTGRMIQRFDNEEDVIPAKPTLRRCMLLGIQGTGAIKIM